MRTLIYCVALILVPTFSLLADEKKPWNVRDHIPLEEFLVQAHRGAGVGAPENTMEAFEIGWGFGATPEADLFTTKDGVIVAFHDENFARVLPNAPDELKSKGIRDFTFEELRQFDVGSWRGEQFAGQRIPSLAEIVEVLKANPKRKFYIDIKRVNFEQLAEETREVHPQLILASTNYVEIERWKRLAPDSYTLHWLGGTQDRLTERLAALKANQFRGIDQLQIHVRFDGDGVLAPSEDFLRQTGDMLREHNILFQVLSWNRASDPNTYRRLMDLGVASFATGYPGVVMRAVKEYYAEQQR